MPSQTIDAARIPIVQIEIDRVLLIASSSLRSLSGTSFAPVHGFDGRVGGIRHPGKYFISDSTTGILLIRIE